jgi:hypothetical protein
MSRTTVADPNVSSALHQAYLQRTYFPELDGLRALCALLVITAHLYSHKEWWAWLAGDRGVSVFFVLSGYLISTLALREEEREGRLSLAAFYVRRCCRLFPLYYLILGFYCLMLLGLGRGSADQCGALAEALPWNLVYCQEIPSSVCSSSKNAIYLSFRDGRWELRKNSTSFGLYWCLSGGVGGQAGASGARRSWPSHSLSSRLGSRNSIHPEG